MIPITQAVHKLAWSPLVIVLITIGLAAACQPGQPRQMGLDPPAGGIAALTIVPSSLTLGVGGAGRLQADGTLSDGTAVANVPVAWTATGGTITAGGLYTAGLSPGTFQVIATQQGGTTADTSLVTISATVATLLQLVLSPASLTLAPGTTGQFTVAGTWSDGSATIPAVTYWATGGTITAGGLYTTGSVPGTYQVIATEQGWGKADTSIVTVTSPPPQPSSCLRTVNSSTVSGFTSALSNAQPGDCILLAAGTYSLSSTLTIARSGTASAPIVVQGVGSSTIINVNQHLMYVDASYFQLRRLRLTDFSNVGLWLRGVTGVIIDSVEVDHTLQEALKFSAGSHHNVVMNSLFHDTGILQPKYGEAIYIGDYGMPQAGATDNQVLNNHFGPNVRAEGVDVKEGSDRTLIRGNFFDGTGSDYIPGETTALISVAAGSVTIDSNFLQYGKPHGVVFLPQSSGTMAGNIATGNTMDLRNIHNYDLEILGFRLTLGTVNGVTVSCSNVMLSGTLSNMPCTQ